MALDYLPSPGWAVIYGETPSATRWSELGDNDDALATGAGIDDDAIINRHIANDAVKAANVGNADQAFAIRYLTTATDQAGGWINFPTDTTLSSGGGVTFPNSHEVKVPRAGRYSAGCVTRIAAGSVTSLGLRINLYRGGVLVDTQGSGQFGSNFSIMNVSAEFDCQANDVITFYAYSNAGYTPTGVNNGPPAEQDRAFINRLWVSENRA